MTDKTVHFCDHCKRELRDIAPGEGIKLNKHEYVVCMECKRRLELCDPVVRELSEALRRLHNKDDEAFVRLIAQPPSAGGIGLSATDVKRIVGGDDWIKTRSDTE
jgi:hypothetical protein